MYEVLLADVVTWQNRIVSYGSKPASQFMAHPDNWRVHPQRQRSALKGSLDTLGWVSVVIENRRSGYVVDGHERVWQALKNGDAEVPFITVDLSPEEEAQALLSLDAIAALAQTDAGKVDELLRLVSTDNTDVMQFLTDMAKDAGLSYGQPPEEAPEPQIDRAAELQVKWGTELGQLWEIGQHRLICGDCTDKAVVDRVMQGERAQAVVTDSPYGIGREGIVNDELKGLRILFDGCLGAMPTENAAIINFQSPRLFPIWVDALRASGHRFERALWFYDETDSTYPWHGWLMTSQIAIVSTIGDAQFAKDVNHHDCYIVKTAGKAGLKRGGYEGNGEAVAQHPTMKPLDIIQELASHTTGIVYEPFCGSGTTIVACERLGRKCRAVEISPAYVAVSLQRLADMGLDPRLIT